MTEGKCTDHGYTVLDGHKNLNVPVLGDIDISLYSKSSTSLTSGDVNIYKITLGECG